MSTAAKKRERAASRIVRNPKICGGQPVIRGTRVTLRTLLASLAEGATSAEILTDFPSITAADLQTVIAMRRGCIR